MDEVLAQARAVVDDLRARASWAASTSECVEVIETTQTLLTQLAAVQADFVAELDGRGHPAKQGAANTRVWLRDQLRISVHAAQRVINLSAVLASRPALAAEVSCGALGVEQATVISTALDDLPEDLDPALVDACEQSLIASARTFEPAALRTIADRVLAHIAPEIADEALRKKLERDELNAQRARAFTITPTRPGIARITGALSTEQAAIVRAALDPLCRPTPGPDGARDERTAAQRRADALIEICAHATHQPDAPESGTSKTHLSVIVDYDILKRQLGCGTLDTGETLSPAAVRRLACDAFIVPAVLGNGSEILDLGRRRRTFSRAQREALILRDGGCAFPECDRPPRWCDGHHVQHWADGGATDVTNGVLLCRRHHRAVHHDGWQVRIDARTGPEFIPPKHVDPLQRPRRNHYHQRP
jgi:hypothetical protein